MKNFTTNQLLQELKDRGYCTSSLWHINDVGQALDNINEDEGTNHTLTDEEKVNILKNAFGFNSDKSKGNELLEDLVRSRLFNLADA